MTDFNAIPPDSSLRGVPVTPVQPAAGWKRRTFTRSAMRAAIAAANELQEAIDGKGTLDKADELLTRAREFVMEASKS